MNTAVKVTVPTVLGVQLQVAVHGDAVTDFVPQPEIVTPPTWKFIDPACAAVAVNVTAVPYVCAPGSVTEIEVAANADPATEAVPLTQSLLVFVTVNVAL